MKAVKKIISGGQTGVDIGALFGALSRDDIETGGWAPKGYLTEDGPKPILLKSFGLKEHKSPKYPPRTIANITDSSFTLLITESRTVDGGSEFTRDMCFKLKKPIFHVIMNLDFDDNRSFHETINWILNRNPKPLTINVAGNRESKSPGIQNKTEKLISDLLAALYFIRG